MSKSLEALERLRNTLLAEGYWQDILQDVFIIEKELGMTQIVKRLFKDANLRDYDHLQPCDKKLVSREEWNNFLKWVKEKDNE